MLRCGSLKIDTKLWGCVDKLIQSFSFAMSELAPYLTLGTVGQIHKEIQGSGNGLLPRWKKKTLKKEKCYS